MVETTTAVSPQSSVVDTPEKIIEETAISAAARIKKKNEAQNFLLFSRNPAEKKNVTSSNAFASSSSTNSYNVLTDRSTSRVLRPPGGHSSIKFC